MTSLTDFVIQHLTDDISRLILERSRHPEIDMSLAVNCIESRRKLKNKVPEWYNEPKLIFPSKLSAEQCSSSATGRYKAELAEKISGQDVWSIADLTGGLGVDAWFFSQKASKVRYNEMLTPLCDAARHNFKTLSAENIEVVNHTINQENSRDLICGYDIVYIDPARRDEIGKKVFLIEDCTPDILTLKDELFKYCNHLLIKLSPMADISMVCNRLGRKCREVHVVSSQGECKELLIWMDRGWNEEYTIIAAELHADTPATLFSFTPSEECNAGMAVSFCHSEYAASTYEKYLFEPGKSLMKAAPYNLISTRFGLGKLGRSTHFYLTDEAEKLKELKAFGKIYRILEVHPLDKRNMKEIGKRYPKADVSARNIQMDTDTLRKRMGITSGGNTHIFGLKNDYEGNILIVTERIF